MKIPTPFRKWHSDVELQLAPLIGCAFVLLIYFIWTSSFAASEHSLPLRIAAQVGRASGRPGEPPPAEDFDPVLVAVRQQGTEIAWTVQDAPMASLAELQQSLTTCARIKPDIPVIIDPASDVELGNVLQVFDIARLSGLSKIQLAATVAVP